MRLIPSQTPTDKKNSTLNSIPNSTTRSFYRSLAQRRTGVSLLPPPFLLATFRVTPKGRQGKGAKQEIPQALSPASPHVPSHERNAAVRAKLILERFVTQQGQRLQRRSFGRRPLWYALPQPPLHLHPSDPPSLNPLRFSEFCPRAIAIARGNCSARALRRARSAFNLRCAGPPAHPSKGNERAS